MAVDLHEFRPNSRQFQCLGSVILLSLIGATARVVCEMIDMKIVDEPSNFGIGGPYGDASQSLSESVLKLRLHPANFSGPPHFRRLLGRCFEAVINDYKYKFCPFQNVTQHEQSVHWNPYHGVLGVWQEWEINNNSFVAMMMKDGDSCGDIFRSVKITFHCGNHSKILEASEPETCKYHLGFQTPLVCHPDSMLVYPVLPQDLRDKWDYLEGEKIRGELTDKGYTKRLKAIFESAGLFLSEKIRASLFEEEELLKHAQLMEGEFDSLDSCKEEFKKLQDKIKSLESRINSCENASNDMDFRFQD